MSIEIINVGPPSAEEGEKLFGLREYEVWVAGQLKARFTHKRTDGAAVCLREAARAVERAKWMEMSKLLDSGV